MTVAVRKKVEHPALVYFLTGKAIFGSAFLGQHIQNNNISNNIIITFYYYELFIVH